jgi:hypothetical protein
VLAADGNIYARPDWHPGEDGPWRMIGVSGFTPYYGAGFVVADGLLLVLSDDRALWATTIDPGSADLASIWERVTPPGLAVGAFAAARDGGIGAIVAVGTDLSVHATLYQPGASTAWRGLTLPATSPAAGAGLVGVVPMAGAAHFFTPGADGRIYAIACDLHAGWSDGQAWEAVSPDSQGFAPRASGALDAIVRVNGQVELFARDAHDRLFKAWWS